MKRKIIHEHNAAFKKHHRGGYSCRGDFSEFCNRIATPMSERGREGIECDMERIDLNRNAAPAIDLATVHPSSLEGKEEGRKSLECSLTHDSTRLDDGDDFDDSPIRRKF